MSDRVTEALRSGLVAIVDTDTVYGLATLPFASGLARIFELKRRPDDLALPWLVSGIDELGKYGHDPNGYASRLAAMFWPGALTLVVSATEAVHHVDGVASDGTVALRCPDNRRCLDLLEALDMPLACTSANLHGEPAPCVIDEVSDQFLQLPGADCLAPSCPRAMASTIVDCTGSIPTILRKGPIPSQVIMDVALFGAKLADDMNGGS